MLEKSIFSTTSPLQTREAGEILAKEILKTALGKRALVLGLVGDLGGGKTTFIRGFARGLGIKQKITSPTFVIMKRFGNFYHIDCYRIKKAKELLDLGFEEIVANSENIVAIEWAGRIQRILPRSTLWISFEFIDNKTRKILLK